MSPEFKNSSERLATQEQLAELKNLISVLTAGTVLHEVGEGENTETYYSYSFRLNNYTQVELIHALQADMGPHSAIIYDYGDEDYQIGKLIVIEKNADDNLIASVDWDRFPSNEYKAQQMPEWKEISSRHHLLEDEAEEQIEILKSILAGWTHQREDITFIEAVPKIASTLHTMLTELLRNIKGGSGEPENGSVSWITAKVWGPRGWNMVDIEIDPDEYTRLQFERDIGPVQDKLFRLIFNEQEKFLLSSESIGKYDASGLALNKMEDYEVAWLFEDLESLLTADLFSEDQSD